VSHAKYFNEFIKNNSLGSELPPEVCRQFLEYHFSFQWIKYALGNTLRLPAQTNIAWSQLEPCIGVTERRFYEGHSWRGWETADEENQSALNKEIVSRFSELSSKFLSEVDLPEPLQKFLMLNIDLIRRQEEQYNRELIPEDEHVHNRSASSDYLEDFDDKEDFMRLLTKGSDTDNLLSDFNSLRNQIFGCDDLEVLIALAMERISWFWHCLWDVSYDPSGADPERFDSETAVVFETFSRLREINQQERRAYCEALATALFPLHHQHSSETELPVKLKPYLDFVFKLLEIQEIYTGETRRLFVRTGNPNNWPGKEDLARESRHRVDTVLRDYYKVMVDEFGKDS